MVLSFVEQNWRSVNVHPSQAGRFDGSSLFASSIFFSSSQCSFRSFDNSTIPRNRFRRFYRRDTPAAVQVVDQVLQIGESIHDFQARRQLNAESEFERIGSIKLHQQRRGSTVHSGVHVRSRQVVIEFAHAIGDRFFRIAIGTFDITDAINCSIASADSTGSIFRFLGCWPSLPTTASQLGIVLTSGFC